MINKLKRKFVVLSTVSTFVLMTVLVVIMNAINYSVVVRESDATIDVLFHTDASFSDKNAPEDIGDRPNGDRKDDGKGDGKIPSGMSPEVPYESRFFTVTVSDGGEIIKTDFSKILTVDTTTASEYVKKALSKGDRGFIGQFRYAKREAGQNTAILFLDVGRKLDSFKAFLWTSTIVGFGGFVIAFIAFLLLSGKIVKPIAESYEKQKRFISDAGHEMKTPLTIINANLDLIESDEYSEELGDIRSQTERMSKLVNNLVYLSKMEESEQKIRKIVMPLSEVVSETANSFRAAAKAKGIEYTTEIKQGVTICGLPDGLRQLVSILLENAMKYSPENGKVDIGLTVCKKSAVLSVFNATEIPIEKNELKYVFDRFYRSDVSRNSATGGHGIGLSIAKAIVETHGGTIKAETESGKDFRVIVNLPIK